MGQCADRLEPDSRILVRHLNGQQRERVGEPVLPVSNDASRRASHSGVGRSEQSGEQFRIHDVERLVRPKPFELVVLVRRVLGVEIRDPRGQVAQHSSCAALLQDALGLGSRPALGGLKCFEQFRVRGVDELRALDQGATLRGDAPDAAAGVVAAVVAEVDFAVLDDRVAPIGEVERAVGPELPVEGTEAGIGGAHHVGHLAGDVGGALVGGFEAHDAVGAEIGGDEVALPVGGEVGAVDDLEAGEFRVVAGADAGELAAGGGEGEVGRAGDGPAHALETGAVGDEGLAVGIELVAPGIDPAAVANLQLLVARVEAEDAAGGEAGDAVGRLGVGAGVNGLGEIEAAVGAPARAVDVVVGVLGAEAAEDDAALIGLAVAIGIAEVEELGALRDVDAAVAGRDAGGNEETVGEDGGFVGAAGAGGVFEDDDLVGGGRAGLDLRINFGAGDPEAAGWVEVHVDRFIEQGIFGPERDLEGGVDGERRDGLRRGFGVEVADA